MTTALQTAVLLAAEDSNLRPGLDQEEVTPGIEGFLLTFLMVALSVVVIRMMVRSVRKVKLRSKTAEDMLVERNQPRLSEKQRQRPEIDELSPDRLGMMRKKYPGYLDSPPLEPQEPESGRDHR